MCLYRRGEGEGWGGVYSLQYMDVEPKAFTHFSRLREREREICCGSVDGVK